MLLFFSGSAIMAVNRPTNERYACEIISRLQNEKISQPPLPPREQMTNAVERSGIAFLIAHPLTVFHGRRETKRGVSSSTVSHHRVQHRAAHASPVHAALVLHLPNKPLKSSSPNRRTHPPSRNVRHPTPSRRSHFRGLPRLSFTPLTDS